MPVALLLCLTFLGLVAGVAVEGLVSSYRTEGVLCLWPRCRACNRPVAPCALGTLLGLPASRHCASCGGSLWGRALPVQVATVAVFDAAGMHAGVVTASLLITLVEISLLLAVLFIDLATRLIPTVLIALLVLLALIHAALGLEPHLGAAVLGGAAGFAGFAILMGLARLRYGSGALGMGDAILALAIGCMTGYPRVVPTLALGIILGGLAALAIIGAAVIRQRPGAGLRGTMPYAPYLALAAILAVTHVVTVP